MQAATDAAPSPELLRRLPRRRSPFPALGAGRDESGPVGAAVTFPEHPPRLLGQLDAPGGGDPHRPRRRGRGGGPLDGGRRRLADQHPRREPIGVVLKARGVDREHHVGVGVEPGVADHPGGRLAPLLLARLRVVLGQREVGERERDHDDDRGDPEHRRPEPRQGDRDEQQHRRQQDEGEAVDEHRHDEHRPEIGNAQRDDDRQPEHRRRVPFGPDRVVVGARPTAEQERQRRQESDQEETHREALAEPGMEEVCEEQRLRRRRPVGLDLGRPYQPAETRRDEETRRRSGQDERPPGAPARPFEPEHDRRGCPLTEGHDEGPVVEVGCQPDRDPPAEGGPQVAALDEGDEEDAGQRGEDEHRGVGPRLLRVGDVKGVDRGDQGGDHAEPCAADPAPGECHRGDADHPPQRRQRPRRNLAVAEQPEPQVEHDRVAERVIVGPGRGDRREALRGGSEDHRVELVEPEALEAEPEEPQTRAERDRAGRGDELGTEAPIWRGHAGQPPAAGSAARAAIARPRPTPPLARSRDSSTR